MGFARVESDECHAPCKHAPHVLLCDHQKAWASYDLTKETGLKVMRWFFVRNWSRLLELLRAAKKYDGRCLNEGDWLQTFQKTLP